MYLLVPSPFYLGIFGLSSFCVLVPRYRNNSALVILIAFLVCLLVYLLYPQGYRRGSSGIPEEGQTETRVFRQCLPGLEKSLGGAFERTERVREKDGEEGRRMSPIKC